MLSSLPQAAYIHVPFCLHRCGYCDFTVVAGRDDLIGAYLECLELELQSQLKTPHSVQTLFIGGGTPSYLSADELKQLFRMLEMWLPLLPGGEFSIECNPEQFTSDRMDALQAAGVNRISLGVQSFHGSHLQTLERSHTADTVADVLDRLRSRQLTNLSLDFIFGVPDQSLQDWESTLQAAVQFQPSHLSTYGLTFEKGTAFWTRRQKRQLQPLTEELEREMYAQAMQWLPEQGYLQYELSNFARSGAECQHNRGYWQGKPYFGFGPGAAAYCDGIRTLNHRSVTTWIKRLQQGSSPVMEREELNVDLRSREAVMLGLRQIEGIDRAEFRNRFGKEIRELAPEAADRFRDAGWLEETSTHMRLTPEGRFLADTVMAEFL